MSGGDGGDRPTVMVTNDDGIDARELRALVRVLVSSKVISGINKGHNCGYHIIYSGTVAGAREAFFSGVPSVSLSYDWVKGRSSDNDFTPAAEASLPIICAILAEIKKKTYPQNCFLNVDMPTDVVNHKGYRLTNQSKSTLRIGWRQVTSDAQGGKMLSTMTMETNSTSSSESESLNATHEHLLFQRVITVTPLGALSPAQMDSQAYIKQWLSGVADCFSSAM